MSRLRFALVAFRSVFGERLALVAAFLTPISILWLDKAPSAEIDMLQVAWVSIAILAFAPRMSESCKCDHSTSGTPAAERILTMRRRRS